MIKCCEKCCNAYTLIMQNDIPDDELSIAGYVMFKSNKLYYILGECNSDIKADNIKPMDRGSLFCFVLRNRDGMNNLVESIPLEDTKDMTYVCAYCNRLPNTYVNYARNVIAIKDNQYVGMFANVASIPHIFTSDFGSIGKACIEHTKYLGIDWYYLDDIMHDIDKFKDIRVVGKDTIYPNVLDAIKDTDSNKISE